MHLHIYTYFHGYFPDISGYSQSIHSAYQQPSPGLSVQDIHNILDAREACAERRRRERNLSCSPSCSRSPPQRCKRSRSSSPRGSPRQQRSPARSCSPVLRSRSRSMSRAARGMAASQQGSCSPPLNCLHSALHPYVGIPR